MSEKDTNQAERNSTVKTSANPTPYLKPNSGRDEPVSGSLVIPIILVIVLAVVVVATFFEDEYNQLLAILGDPDQDSTSEVLVSGESSDDTHVSETAIGTSEPVQLPGATVTVTAVNTDTESTQIAAEAGSSTDSSGNDEATVSTDTAPVAPAGPSTPDSSPYASAPWYNSYYASPDYGTPYQGYAYPDSKEQQEMLAEQHKIWDEIEDQRRKDWEAMMERRRQAWLEADAKRREHRENTHNIRTAVLKRIEQDRAEMDRQIQEMNEEMDKHRDQAERRMMEFRRRADRTEI